MSRTTLRINSSSITSRKPSETRPLQLQKEPPRTSTAPEIQEPKEAQSSTSAEPKKSVSVADYKNSSTLEPKKAPSEFPPNKFTLKAKTQAEEDGFDPTKHRNVQHPSGFIATVANLVKGALGAGILSTHVAYMKGGALFSSITNIFLGVYITYCYWLLIYSARILYKRTHTSRMTYSDLGEAALAVTPNPTLAKFAKPFRYIIDGMVSVDLFGSCCAYQLIVAATVKQMVEHSKESNSVENFGIRVYLAVLIVPFILICLIRHLQWLAPLSLVANFMIACCIGLTIYYAFQLNPKFEGLVHTRSLSRSVEYIGMIVFSMSCIGVILPTENNMKNPNMFILALFVAMCIIVLLVFLSGLFGYVAYLDKSEAPITINYPMTTLTGILKGCMAFMVFVTHALNFWVPFELCFYYIDKRIKNRSRVICYEFLCRALFCLIISIIAIIFPTISGIIGFLGCFCLANLIFVFPNLIYLLVIWERPGLGVFYWRLIQWFFITGIGLILFALGSYVNGAELVQSLNVKNDDFPQ